VDHSEVERPPCLRGLRGGCGGVRIARRAGQPICFADHAEPAPALAIPWVLRHAFPGLAYQILDFRSERAQAVERRRIRSAAAKCSDCHRRRRRAPDGRQPDRDEATSWRTALRAFGERGRTTRTGHETWGTGDAAAEEGCDAFFRA